MFNPLHSKTIDQELFERHLCNQSSHYENTNTVMPINYRLKGEHYAPLYTAVQAKNFSKSILVKSNLYENTDD